MAENMTKRTMETLPGHGKKIAMLVSNPCSPDSRVNKQAESLAAAGYEVRVFCTWRPGMGIPTREVINGVTYIRYEWHPMKLLRKLLLSEQQYPGIPSLDRESHRRIMRRSKR